MSNQAPACIRSRLHEEHGNHAQYSKACCLSSSQRYALDETNQLRCLAFANWATIALQNAGKSSGDLLETN